MFVESHPSHPFAAYPVRADTRVCPYKNGVNVGANPCVCPVNVGANSYVCPFPRISQNTPWDSPAMAQGATYVKGRGLAPARPGGSTIEGREVAAYGSRVWMMDLALLIDGNGYVVRGGGANPRFHRAMALAGQDREPEAATPEKASGACRRSERGLGARDVGRNTSSQTCGRSAAREPQSGIRNPRLPIRYV